ncbi:hypothetical protein BJ741DRAFT_436685 [Chytriomyces cf. hyalinus JEL632]|nr:hypothetical protein BJ741DRAFT_436685 [Chytriomyces cf. hyalinus JEL632]
MHPSILATLAVILTSRHVHAQSTSSINSIAQTSSTLPSASLQQSPPAAAAQSSSSGGQQQQQVTSSTSTASPSPSPPPPTANTIPTAPLPITQHGPIQPRFGASAQLLRDQGLVLFVGGYGGTWAQSTAAPDAGIVALNVRSGFSVNSNANWVSVAQPFVSTQANESSPLAGAYGVGVVARGADLDLGSYTGDVFHYVFAQLGPRDGAIPGLFPTTTVYQ